MKDGFKEILGRRIAAVVVAHNARTYPHDQVFLVFDDGKRFELYGEAFTCCSGVDRGEGIDEYVNDAGGEIVRVYLDTTARRPPPGTGPDAAPYVVSPATDLETRLRLEVAAWEAARAAIDRARRR